MALLETRGTVSETTSETMAKWTVDLVVVHLRESQQSLSRLVCHLEPCLLADLEDLLHQHLQKKSHTKNDVSFPPNLWVKQCHKPPMTGNSYTSSYHLYIYVDLGEFDNKYIKYQYQPLLR